MSGPSERTELLAFIHVPKTAGTTLTALMRYHYRGRFLTSGNIFSRFEQVEAKLGEIAATKPHIGAVAGHFTVGLADRLLTGARCMTILRDPIERTLSHYYFLVQPLAGRKRAAERGYIPDNLQTRMLCGIVSPYDRLPPEALEQAKRNLRERFGFVGTTERFNEFLAVLNLELGWPTVAYRDRRVHALRPRKDNVPAGDLQVAEERNLLDRELHAYAGELLDLAIARSHPEVENEVEVLRRALRRWNGEDERGPPAARPPLPLDARVELALKESQLAQAEARLRKLASALKREARKPRDSACP